MCVIRNSSCSGLCSPGYYCPMASTSSTQSACPAGIYGAESGLTSRECSPMCETSGAPNATSSLGSRFCKSRTCSAGYICPVASVSPTQQECGGVNVFCPPGSVVPTPVSSGYYTIGAISAPLLPTSDDESTRTSQQQCEPGYWCSGGVRSECPAGYFGGDVGMVSPTCSGPCTAGYICTSASPSSTQHPCGLNSSVYCPEGSFRPVSVRLFVLSSCNILYSDFGPSRLLFLGQLRDNQILHLALS